MARVKQISVALTRKGLAELKEMCEVYGENMSQVVHRALYQLYFKTRVKDELREARKAEKKITRPDDVLD